MGEQNQRIYEFGPFRLDAQKRLLLREGKTVKLFPKEFDTLLALVERSGRVLDKDELMRAVWGELIVEEGNLAKNISHLRKVLGEKRGQHQYIVTVPGQGYRFVAGVRARSFDEVLVHEHTRVTIEQEEETADASPSISDQSSFLKRRDGDLSFPSQSAIRKALTGHKMLVAGGLLGVLLAIGGIALWRNREKQAGGTPIPFQQTTIKRLEIKGEPGGGAALSPDGKLFAYVLVDNEGRRSLWLGHVEGVESVQLRPPAELFYPSLTFQPDGSHLYFTVVEGFLSPNGTLYRVPVFGGVVEKVKENVRNRIAFSPDGKQFAFVRHDTASRRSSLVIADAIGTSEREIVSHSGRIGFVQHSPSWSPDGSMIAAGVTEGQNSELVIVSAVEGSIKPLTDRTWKEIRRTEWLSDSSGLIMVASDTNSEYSLQLWYVSYPAGEARAIGADLDRYGSQFNLSADGKSILAVRGQAQSNIWMAASDDLHNAKQITFDLLGRTSGWFGLDWTADGRIVFTAFVNQSQTLWAVDADGSNKKQLLPTGYMSLNPSVTADGRFVVFASDRSGSSEIWRASIDGNDLKQLTTGGNNSQPHVSPDGKWVVYKSSRDDLETLRRVSLDGGEPALLTEKAASWPSVSPDGKLIACAYEEGKTKLGILPFEGGSPVKVFDVPRTANFNNGIRWTPDGKAVTYRDWVNGIWKQTLDEAAPNRLEGLPHEKLYAYSWSRDGKRFAFARGTALRDVVLIRDLR